ncbi:MAG TPA: transglycosylase domain-containing protein [Anaerolineae bacterium]|nr:transglycosylase domain-containing protein [Anaerolineae bacterium]
MRRYLILGIVLLVMGLGGGMWWLLGDLPAPETVYERGALPTVVIVDREERPLYNIIDSHSGRHTILDLETIPLFVRQATMATEDKNFYENPGVDWEGIVRAFVINIRGGEVVAGGSTITQQVARNLLLDDEERAERTVKRKLRESWLAWRVARVVPKEDILGLYLNQMYYGAGAYGIEAAAQTYFGRRVDELTVAQGALLVGLTQAPSVYNPLVAPELAKERQEVVLGLMWAEGYLDEAGYEQAMRERLVYSSEPYPLNGPHFVMMVTAEVDRLLTAEEIRAYGGVTVRTTLDYDWQMAAERIVAEQLTRLNEPVGGGVNHQADNAALVAMTPEGEVRALVGNRDYFDEATAGAVNMALVRRQPGSALKPFVYAAGLDPNWGGALGDGEIWTAATMLPDVRQAFETHEGASYVPVNFSRTENGPVLLRQALGSSLNIPAVWALDKVGVDEVVRLMTDLGIEGWEAAETYDLSLALGGAPVSLWDLTAAYGALANGGYRFVPQIIDEIRAVDGRVIYEAPAPEMEAVLDERVAWLLTDILSDNDARRLSFGENSVLRLDRPAAVKTGTTNDFHDNWTVGYTPDVVVGVWVGNADGRPMVDVTGVSGAGPIWHYFMRAVLTGEGERPFVRPAGILRAEVCALSGMAPTDMCPYRRSEWFLAGTQPTDEDTFYRNVVVERGSWQLATERTPISEQVEMVVLDLPVLLQPWAREAGLMVWDDLLVREEGIKGTEEVVLQIVYPDPETRFRLTGEESLAAQRIRIEAAVAAGLGEVQLWVDGEVVAEPEVGPWVGWWGLVEGEHEVWVTAKDRAGQLWRSDVVRFEVCGMADGTDLPERGGC